MNKTKLIFLFFIAQITLSNHLTNFIFVNPSSEKINKEDIQILFNGDTDYKTCTIDILPYDALEIPISSNKEIMKIKVRGELIKDCWTNIPNSPDGLKAIIVKNCKSEWIYRIDFCNMNAKQIKKLIVTNWTGGTSLKLNAIKYLNEPFIRFYIRPIKIEDYKSNLIPINTIVNNGLEYGQSLEIDYCGFDHNQQSMNFNLPNPDEFDCRLSERIKSGQFAVGVELSNGNPPCSRKNFYIY